MVGSGSGAMLRRKSRSLALGVVATGAHGRDGAVQWSAEALKRCDRPGETGGAAGRAVAECHCLRCCASQLRLGEERGSIVKVVERISERDPRLPMACEIGASPIDLR